MNDIKITLIAITTLAILMAFGSLMSMAAEDPASKGFIRNAPILSAIFFMSFRAGMKR